MSEETVSSMHDARDAEDKRLLDAKEHKQLLDNYVYLVQEWAAVRVRDRQAVEAAVAQPSSSAAPSSPDALRGEPPSR